MSPDARGREIANTPCGALAGAAATGSMPEIMAAVFGDTRVSARMAHNQKTPARCPARASP
jgi:hypothetical protein